LGSKPGHAPSETTNFGHRNYSCIGGIETQEVSSPVTFISIPMQFNFMRFIVMISIKFYVTRNVTMQTFTKWQSITIQILQSQIEFWLR